MTIKMRISKGIFHLALLVLCVFVSPVEMAHHKPKLVAKRGLVYIDPPDLIQNFNGHNSLITWGYNYASVFEKEFPRYLEYVPQLWSAEYYHTHNWTANVNYAISRGTKNILTFNEPDLSSQANMSPQKAANAYLQYVQPFAGRVNLGGPAVTESPNGTQWLVEFLSLCIYCTIDFIPVHIYGTVNDIGHYQRHIQQINNITGKPIWVTEFHATGNEESQAAFLEILMPWLDAQDYVHRYSWYKCSYNYTGGNLCDLSGKPSALGKLYETFI